MDGCCGNRVVIARIDDKIIEIYEIDIFGVYRNNIIIHAKCVEKYIPPRVDHLDVVGGLTPSMKWKPRIHSALLTREPGRAVALGRVLVLT
jgi:hypothetical protein